MSEPLPAPLRAQKDREAAKAREQERQRDAALALTGCLGLDGHSVDDVDGQCLKDITEAYKRGRERAAKRKAYEASDRSQIRRRPFSSLESYH
jgi:nicotinamide mononucleotide (NMN) deamidase PncC